MSFSSSNNRRNTNVSILINVPFVWTRFYKVCTECEWTDKKRTALKIPYDCAKDGNTMIVDTLKRVWPSLDKFDRCAHENDNGSWTLRVTCNAYCRHGKLSCSIQGLACFVNSIQVARGWNRNGFCRFFDSPYMSSYSHRNLSRSTNTTLLDWLFYWVF